jgi:transketolase
MLQFSPMNIKIWSRLGSAGVFGQAALSLPEINPNTVVLTADLAVFSGLERFKTAHPERFYNFGIAEQNMLCAAAGMAKEGLTPFITTYATFATMRSADQIKVCMGYMNLGVKLVGMSSGFSVGGLGATHMSLEDIALVRSIPNVVILSPADCTATVKATWAAAKIDAPVYLRLSGTMNMPVVYSEDFEFEIGKGITLREGQDIAIIATGSMVHYAKQAAELLMQAGISAELIDMHTIKPLDLAVIERNLDKKLIVTVEEHSRIGGLGGAVAEVLSLKSRRPPHLIIGTDDHYLHAAGYSELIEQSGLSAPQLFTKIMQVYKEIV